MSATRGVCASMALLATLIAFAGAASLPKVAQSSARQLNDIESYLSSSAQRLASKSARPTSAATSGGDSGGTDGGSSARQFGGFNLPQPYLEPYGEIHARPLLPYHAPMGYGPPPPGAYRDLYPAEEEHFEYQGSKGTAGDYSAYANPAGVHEITGEFADEDLGDTKSYKYQTGKKNAYQSGYAQGYTKTATKGYSISNGYDRGSQSAYKYPQRFRVKLATHFKGKKRPEVVESHEPDAFVLDQSWEREARPSHLPEAPAKLRKISSAAALEAPKVATASRASSTGGSSVPASTEQPSSARQSAGDAGQASAEGSTDSRGADESRAAPTGSLARESSGGPEDESGEESSAREQPQPAETGAAAAEAAAAASAASQAPVNTGAATPSAGPTGREASADAPVAAIAATQVAPTDAPIVAAPSTATLRSPTSVASKIITQSLTEAPEGATLESAREARKAREAGEPTGKVEPIKPGECSSSAKAHPGEPKDGSEQRQNEMLRMANLFGEHVKQRAADAAQPIVSAIEDFRMNAEAAREAIGARLAKGGLAGGQSSSSAQLEAKNRAAAPANGLLKAAQDMGQMVRLV